MTEVIVGAVDPHKKSVTVEVTDVHGQRVARGRIGTATGEYQPMLG